VPKPGFSNGEVLAGAHGGEALRQAVALQKNMAFFRQPVIHREIDVLKLRDQGSRIAIQYRPE
jgi:hypothetical protein